MNGHRPHWQRQRRGRNRRLHGRLSADAARKRKLDQDPRARGGRQYVRSVRKRPRRKRGHRNRHHYQNARRIERYGRIGHLIGIRRHLRHRRERYGLGRLWHRFRFAQYRRRLKFLRNYALRRDHRSFRRCRVLFQGVRHGKRQRRKAVCHRFRQNSENGDFGTVRRRNHRHLIGNLRRLDFHRKRLRKRERNRHNLQRRRKGFRKLRAERNRDFDHRMGRHIRRTEARERIRNDIGNRVFANRSRLRHRQRHRTTFVLRTDRNRTRGSLKPSERQDPQGLPFQ